MLLCHRRVARLATPLRALARAHGGHSHGHSHSHSPAPPKTPAGPRPTLAIGLEMTRAMQNLGRMLEGYAEASTTAYQDVFDSVWHGRGLIWRQQQPDAGGPVASTVADELSALGSQRGAPVAAPSLISLRFSDCRTALARLSGADGCERFLSCVRVSEVGSNRGPALWSTLPSCPSAAAHAPPPCSISR